MECDVNQLEEIKREIENLNNEKIESNEIDHLDIKDEIRCLEKSIKRKEKIYENKMRKMFSIRKLEKQGLEIKKDIEEDLHSIHSLHSHYENQKRKLDYLQHKEAELKKEVEGKELKSGLYLNIKKVIQLEDIQHRFNCHYRHHNVIKLLNEKSVLVYDVMEERLELRQMNDLCNFSEIFLNLSKQDEFFLNFREKLIIVMSNHVFEYDSKTNVIIDLPKLTEDHKGGALIYVPLKNTIMCVSGLSSNVNEGLGLDKKFNYPTIVGWSEINKLNKARGYFSIYLQNESIIYTAFGFNLFTGDYLSTIEKYDTSKDKQEWNLIYLSSEKSFYSTFSAVLPITDQEIYLIGGKDHMNHDIPSIICINLKRYTVEDTQMKLGKGGKYAVESQTKNLFYQETCFLPLATNANELILANFDSKNYLHMINLKTFDYTYIHRRGYDRNSDSGILENSMSSEGSNNVQKN